RQITSMYSPYGRGTRVGRMVRFTPNGWSVISRQRLISLARSSGVGCVSAVRMPSAPALDTAEASSARPTHCMPPCTIGCLMPNISVKRVLIISFVFPAGRSIQHYRTTRSRTRPRNGLPLRGLRLECRVQGDLGLEHLGDRAADLRLVGQVFEGLLVG